MRDAALDPVPQLLAGTQRRRIDPQGVVTRPWGVTRFGAYELVSHQVHRAVDPRHRRAGPQAAKDLGALDLVVFGVGVIIGAGIFVLTGRWPRPTRDRRSRSLPVRGDRLRAGRSLLRGVRVDLPVAGSAYTFSTPLGELVAWIIGVGPGPRVHDRLGGAGLGLLGLSPGGVRRLRLALPASSPLRPTGSSTCPRSSSRCW